MHGFYRSGVQNNENEIGALSASGVGRADTRSFRVLKFEQFNLKKQIIEQFESFVEFRTCSIRNKVALNEFVVMIPQIMEGQTPLFTLVN